MIIIFGVDNVFLLVAGFSILALVLFIAIKMNKIRNQEIEKHIENLTFNVARENTSLSTFPLPMVTMELNGMIIWSRARTCCLPIAMRARGARRIPFERSQRKKAGQISFSLNNFCGSGR